MTACTDNKIENGFYKLGAKYDWKIQLGPGPRLSTLFSLLTRMTDNNGMYTRVHDANLFGKRTKSIDQSAVKIDYLSFKTNTPATGGQAWVWR